MYKSIGDSSLCLFPDRPWTTIFTRAPRPMDPSTISWMAWALWRTISQTSPCPRRRANPAKGRRPTTYATFASTKDTTSKTALRWVMLQISQVQSHTRMQQRVGYFELSIKCVNIWRRTRVKNIQSAVWWEIIRILTNPHASSTIQPFFLFFYLFNGVTGINFKF